MGEPLSCLRMSDDTMQCSTCGLPQSDWMDGLCPVCLLGLGDATGDSERMVEEIPVVPGTALALVAKHFL